MQCPGESRALHFLRAAGAARARCILARVLEPALCAAPNQAMGARQSSFLRVARSAPVGDALNLGLLNHDALDSPLDQFDKLIVI